MSAAAATLRLSIPASPDWIVVARLAIAAVADRLGFTLDEVEDLKLAVAEACTGCIINGPEGRAIELACDIDAAALRVSVSDQGGVHDGLGVTIVRALMDGVAFTASEGGTTALVLTKHRR